jgi:hypothetical protein
VEEGTGLAGWSKYRRYAAAAVAVVLAGGVVVIMLTTVARSASAGFLHIRLNLSATRDYTSADPALAISPDHNWVAVAWVEGYVQSKTDSRGHVYLRAASESAGGFGSRIAVYTGSGSACAFDRAAVAVTGTTAHIAYTVYDDCDTPDYTRLYYRTCSLTSGTCGSSELITSTATSQYWITWVDLAVDESGNPHVVFARYEYEASELVGKIFYAARNGGAWGNSESVYGTGDNGTPAIAWGGSCAHVAWQSEGETLSRIIYKRRCAGVWGAEINLYSAAVGTPPHRPDVAARSGRVFVVWGARYGTTPETYALIYARSNNNGTSFPSGGWREVVSDYDASRYSDFTEYTPGGAEATYLEHLQPSIDLNDDGWPAVVWHTGGVTGTYYSYAITGTTNSVDWITTTLLMEGSSGAASVGFGEPISETVPLLHFTYMEMTDSAWDVYYDSSQEYDYLGRIYLPLVLKND